MRVSLLEAFFVQTCFKMRKGRRDWPSRVAKPSGTAKGDDLWRLLSDDGDVGCLHDLEEVRWTTRKMEPKMMGEQNKTANFEVILFTLR